MKLSETEKNMITTISLRLETKNKLRDMGVFGDNWDELINKLIIEVKNKR